MTDLLERQQAVREGLAAQEWLRVRDRAPSYLRDCAWWDCPELWRSDCLEYADAILELMSEKGVVLKVEGREDDSVHAVMAAPLIQESKGPRVEATTLSEPNLAPSGD